LSIPYSNLKNQRTNSDASSNNTNLPLTNSPIGPNLIQVDEDNGDDDDLEFFTDTPTNHQYVDSKFTSFKNKLFPKQNDNIILPNSIFRPRKKLYSTELVIDDGEATQSANLNFSKMNQGGSLSMPIITPSSSTSPHNK
jgi:hypothetical protein